jgi:hypothetical protein
LLRRGARISFGLYASPAYRAKMNAGDTPAFIGFDEESDFIAEVAWLARQFGDRRFSFRANRQTTQAAAARAGNIRIYHICRKQDLDDWSRGRGAEVRAGGVGRCGLFTSCW